MSTQTVRPPYSFAAYSFACELVEMWLCFHTVDDPQTSEAIQHLLKQLQLVDTDAPMESLQAILHLQALQFCTSRLVFVVMVLKYSAIIRSCVAALSALGPLQSDVLSKACFETCRQPETWYLTSCYLPWRTHSSAKQLEKLQRSCPT